MPESFDFSGSSAWRFMCTSGVTLLFGRDSLGEVPQFKGVILGHGDQAGLNGVKVQCSDTIKVAP